MYSAVAAVEVATIDVRHVVISSSMPQFFLVLASWVSCVHLSLLRHVQTVEIRVLYALYL